MKTQDKKRTTCVFLKFFPTLLTMGGAGLFFTTTSCLSGQEARFFRISGPAATAITAFLPDGSMVWSNAQPGGTYTVQTASSSESETNWVDYVQIPTTNSVHTNLLIDFHPPAGMTLIPAGSFTIGDTLDGDSEARPTNVTVSTFYMETNLVSYSLWQSVYNWATNHGYGFDNAGSGKAANHPVHTVNWFDALKWCNARSQQEGLTPIYLTGFLKVYTNGQIHALAIWTANGYRLPTEAEWEKAARGGLSGQRFPWGNTISLGQANYYGDTAHYSYDLGPNGYNAAFATGSVPWTSPAGYFGPNGYGLYDMAGNMAQWCWDWWWTPYVGGTDPHGADGKNARVYRGGAWSGPAFFARSAYRTHAYPDASTYYIGLRCVRKL
jgi:sulfatase modifying factor 1